MKSLYKFFSISIWFNVLLLIITPVLAADLPAEKIVDYNQFFGAGNLKIAVGDNPAPGIRVQQSGSEIEVEAKNLGRSSIAGVPNSFIYSALLTYKFTVHVFTTCPESEAFISPPQKSDCKIRFLKTYTAVKVPWPSLWPGTYNEYFLKYSSYTMPTSLGPKAKGYTGPISVAVAFESLAPSKNSFAAQGFTISSSNFDARISQSVVTDYKITTIDDKDTSYTSLVITSPVTMDADNDTLADKMDSSTMRNLVEAAFMTNSLGINSISQPINNVPFAGAIGQGSTSSYTGNINQIFVDIKPDVTLIQQTVNYVSNDMVAISTGDRLYTGRIEPEFTKAYVPNSFTRTIGWTTKNYDLALNCMVSVRIDTTIDYASTTDGENWDPTEVQFRQGDIMWDDYLNDQDLGFEPLNQSAGDSFALWAEEYWWILALAGAALFAFWLIFMSPIAFSLQSKIVGGKYS